MAVRQYIGARYVAKIYVNSLDPSSADWESGVAYEPLTMVTYNSSSYISRKAVAASVGNPADNPDYWAVTGLYNGQIAQLQSDVAAIENQIDDALICIGDLTYHADADGTKTIKDLMGDVADQIKAYIVANPTYSIIPISLTIENGVIEGAEPRFIPNYSGGNLLFQRTVLSASAETIKFAAVNSTNSSYLMSVNGSITDHSTDIATVAVYVRFTVYMKINL